MNRRENLKLLFTGTLASGFLLTNCAPEDKKLDYSPRIEGGTAGGRTEEEKLYDQKLLSETFLTEDERKKLNVLVDIIMPADTDSPSATEVGVVDFIEFMVKDYPGYQTPMRGGLMWLDHYSEDNYGKIFLALDQSEKLEIIDQIAWPEKAKSEMEGGVKFFNMLRNLTSTGYFTTEAGFKYLGYVGNRPNVWDGVPEEVMKRHGFELPKKYLDTYLKPEERGELAQWDDEGNILRKV
ncbi:gluconate 2-dehydrogenase subunit 3 family protein [Belliella aquatica]|uniref:Transcriptional initiation protein Tat n=1 Tax=Belliella aquatica TaxID=1323734 RepID=A0ABQ1MT31_9BACT|nr:gluconate 2-dehydrogenase subunit 3 family protein [Belliella aquatica]MCH7406493.1 gluconate 2-dehydrogenase subunit 3 family protein [Belliella aquatica]GGC46473.1 transcriptional initiation protein Tat [Belliella aquatica]